MSSFNHRIESENHITVGNDPQETDLKIINITSRGDVVVTQDTGLAAVVLARGAAAISPWGRVFNPETVEFLLEEREIKSKIRRSGGRTKGPAKRTENENVFFRKKLFELIDIGYNIPGRKSMAGIGGKNIMEIFRKRYSVRKFKPDEISGEMVEAMLDAARWAPTAGNRQPWFFYVVRSREHREALASFALNQRFIVQAPLCFVVCAEPDRSAKAYGIRGRDLYSIQDTAAAVQNILLAATGLGLGSCWVGAFDEEKVHGYLEMPPHRRPVAIIPVGHADTDGSKRPGRREIREITRFL